MSDPVTHPAHYQLDGLEVIDVITAAGWIKPFLLASCCKYILRAGKKADEIEDLRKARYCLDRLIEMLETEDDRRAAEWRDARHCTYTRTDERWTTWG